ncbi:hypothetical protein [Streptomyces sp. NPDC001435]|uniref:hypothetical protein n=1 Tax=unclassified Streptomyces TaxID=2593676 RepID=UPI0036AE9268
MQQAAHVLRDHRLVAVKAVWDALRPLGLGLIDAERVVHSRYEVLGDRVRRTQPDPLDVTSLAARAAAHPGSVAAIEALWDGDTVHDWFVLLVSVLEDPSGQGHLATVYHRARAPAGAGRPQGRTGLAHYLGVPFHFASPDVPDDEAPRWRTVQRLPEDPSPKAQADLG